MFSLSDLRSIQINLQDVNLDEEIEDTFKNFKLLDDPLGNMENLEELDVTVRVSVTWEDEGEVPNEVFLGYGQLVAENLPQVRQRCSLKIRHGSISQHVCWRHLFEQGAVVEDRGDYRDQTRKFCSYVLMLRRLKMEEREKEEDGEDGEMSAIDPALLDVGENMRGDLEADEDDDEDADADLEAAGDLQDDDEDEGDGQRQQEDGE